MPQRFLKPGIRGSEKLHKCSSDEVRWFWALLLTLVDDFGRYEANSTRLRHELYPLRDDIRTDQVRIMLDEIGRSQLALFYSADGKHYLALTGWDERARYPSRFPEPPDTKLAKALGCKLNAELSVGQLKLSPRQQQTPEPVASSQTPKPPEGERDAPANAPTLALAQAHFADINRRMREEPGYEPKGDPFTVQEVKEAFLSLEATKDEFGQWWWGKRPVGDWRAAMEARILSQRKLGPPEKTPGKVGANEIQEQRKIKRL